MKTLLLGVCWVVLSLTSCNSSRNLVQLSDVKWVLESMDGKSLQMKENDKEVFIEFNGTDKRASGMAGCNRFFGAYEMEGTKLNFSQMGSTRMACPEMETETSFFQVLDRTDAYVIKEHQLSFLQKGKVIAVFKAKPEEKKHE